MKYSDDERNRNKQQKIYLASENRVWNFRLCLQSGIFNGKHISAYFYTDVAGIPAASAAFMFLITKFIDAFTDYMVGALVDRTNTKMGRNRPWMLAGAPVLAIGMVLVFTTPDFSTGGKLAWAYITYIIFSFGYTLVNIPMGSILPTLSADATERTKIATTRTIFRTLDL